MVKHAETWLTAHPTGPRFVWVHFMIRMIPTPPAPYSQTYKDRLYDGEIAYADSALGSFIAYLKSHSSYDNSLVIVVGDHGEGLGEHGEDTHGIFLYDSTTHVPLIVKLPAGKFAGKVVDDQVGTLDILPSALELAGIEKLDVAQGSSLLPVIEKPQKISRTQVGKLNIRFASAGRRCIRCAMTDTSSLKLRDLSCMTCTPTVGN